MDRLEKDPEYQDEAAQQAMDLLQEEGLRGGRCRRMRGGPDYDFPGGPGMMPWGPQGPVDVIQQYREIAENFPKGGGLGNLLDPTVLTGLIGLAQTLLAPKNNGNSHGDMISPKSVTTLCVSLAKS